MAAELQLRWMGRDARRRDPLPPLGHDAGAAAVGGDGARRVDPPVVWPALEPSQRLFLEVHGYCVLEKVLVRCPLRCPAPAPQPCWAPALPLPCRALSFPLLTRTIHGCPDPERRVPGLWPRRPA